MNKNTNDGLKAGQAMDVLVAEKIMGWRWVHFKTATESPEHTSEGYDHITLQEPEWCAAAGGLIQNGYEYASEKQLKLPRTGYGGCPMYSERIEFAFKMEAELDRRGLQLAYIHELFRVVIMEDRAAHSSSDFLWRIARASPEQRCRAALACVEGK